MAEPEASTIGKAPDIMNDATFAPQNKTSMKSQEEADTCRICRGEGTPEEPLFHPCKCSGSIKFVHQECLMEWLSHSQKKHCELCKTSFRFTKLYQSQMPQSLPTLVFIRKAALHILQALLTWARQILVITIWSIWLPWCMRYVWSGLFWLGDGGFLQEYNNMKRTQDAVSAARDLGRSQNTSTTTAITTSGLFKSPLLRDVFRFWTNHFDSTPVSNTTLTNVTMTRTLHRGSLLSGLKFFQDMSPSPAFNKFILDTAEGQVITLSVVTGFILVFLIREWVVQQGPALNLAAHQDGPVNPHPANNADEDRPVDAQPAPPNTPRQVDEPAIAEDTMTAASLIRAVSSDDSTNPLDPDATAIQELIIELRACSTALDWFARGGSTEWQGDGQELNRAREAVKRTQSMYARLKSISKRSLDKGRIDYARSALDRLGLLREALTYLPWASERELGEMVNNLQAYMDTAYELLTVQQELMNEGVDPATLVTSTVDEGSDMAVDGSDDSTEPLLDPTQLDSSADELRETEHSGEIVEEARPTMPERMRSSMATSIRRDLEEARDLTPEVPVPLHDLVRNDGDASSHDGWSFVDVPRDQHKTDLNRLVEDEDTGEHGRSAYDMPHLNAQTPIIDETPVVPTSAEPDSTEFSPELTSEPQSASTLAAGQGSSEQATSNTSEESSNPPVPVESIAVERSYTERILDWIFGDLVPAGPPQPLAQDGNAEHVVDDVAAEAPFVPFQDNRPNLHAGNENEEQPDQPANDALAAAQAANVAQDAEAIEEAEDLEGILELIGMQGPLAGLFQNAVFAAVLTAATISTAILIPYVCGKLIFLLMANPIGAINLPLRTLTNVTNTCIDLAIALICTALAIVDTMVWSAINTAALLIPALNKLIRIGTLGKAFRNTADAATVRLLRSFYPTAERAEQVHFAVDSLAALRSIQSKTRAQVSLLDSSISGIYSFTSSLPHASIAELGPYFVIAYRSIMVHLSEEAQQVMAFFASIPSLLRSGRLVFSISGGSNDATLDALLDHWTIPDRVTAVLTGYFSFAMAGALYVKRGAPFSTSEQGRKIEHLIREIFLQSAGVLKVILIIGIEMLAFPLYCGFLLDTAMLPLFGDATLAYRISFTRSSVYTSMFFHWFIGTCYMFHFALYVAMCRKVFRKGVLYFIRDPDDPNFHPVRDVLERSVSSQLRKIAFSALVYGGLVIFCMGSVVWAVAYCIPSVFPVRLTAKDSYFGYPVDLLLYHILAPLAIHFLRPSKGLQTVYDWWFRKSARILRLSNFLFNESYEDETDFPFGDGVGASQQGSFVRAPASDHVRLPRGRSVLMAVDADNNRLDGQPEPEGKDEAHSPTNEKYAKVWVPPLLRYRIVAFLFLMWVISALVGLGTTVLPLVLGRKLISTMTSFQTNDLYSYVAGISPLLAAFYARRTVMRGYEYMKATIRLDASTINSALSTTGTLGARALRIIYTYSIFILIVPSIIACLLECYFILPLQTYTSLPSRPAAPHTVYLIQDWTLGLLYLRIVLRIMLWDGETRLARGLHAIVARGWLDPDARVATRCFIVPLSVLAAAAILLPAGIAALVAQSFGVIAHNARLPGKLSGLGADDVAALQTDMIRFSYPFVLALALSLWSMAMLKRAAGRWRMRIRDEIYLIGERLHNHGEVRPPAAAAPRA